MAFNDVLEKECGAILRCRYDNDALFAMSSNRVNGSLTANTSQWRFVDRDISTQDHFHPSFAGQRKLAAEAFASGYDFTDRTAPTVVVTPATAANGERLAQGERGGGPLRHDLVGVRGFEHRVHQPDGRVG